MAYKQRFGKIGPIRMTDPENKIPDGKSYANRSIGEKLVSKSSSITPGGSTPFSGYSTTISRTYATPGTPGSYTPPKFTPAGDAAYKKMSLSERKIADNKYIAANTKPGTKGTTRTVTQTLKFAGIQPVAGAKITGSMAGLQPLVKKPPTGTSIIPPPPQKTRKKFKNTDVGKFIKKVGDIRIRLPRIRLPKLGFLKKSSGKGCTRCARKHARQRGR